MTQLAIIRHGPTDWNAEGRFQGRADRFLSEEGRLDVASWRLPDDVKTWRVLASPLSRARKTAMLLTGREPDIDPRLIEMDFGEWEGEQLAELRERLGEEMRVNEARGLDFTPPGGESPRMVMDRLRPLLAELAEQNEPCLVIAHKAVIRALYAMATGWDMTADAPEKLKNACLHRFDLSADGSVSVISLNEALT
ncbi:histidine phosphatase family protein [Hwanghaeella grinnelliae]|uniref:Histidine phosphatase family protein n=1 Tax=Hwanghaeella grinnelliae TaxID=2500179 RepID=A0A437QNX9_9PROT|nr:histidine phosphatase family protein [Hwanghaeella grinnelliae]RVU36266.1 histidine phosphatase family protein [Hwanghaeella grinnelliae]